jgi:hypothetical protein
MILIGLLAATAVLVVNLIFLQPVSDYSALVPVLGTRPTTQHKFKIFSEKTHRSIPS